MNPLHVLILAAGDSSRLGQPKQLVRLGGRPVLHRVVASASQLAGHAVTVVVGAHAERMTRLLAHSSASVIVNRQWREGMGSSLRFGVAALPPGCEAVLVLLGDQVGVTAEDLRRLASAWRGQDSAIAASVYEGRVGPPAIFPRITFSELAQSRGDEGARRVLGRNSWRLVRVPMPNAALDLDTPEDLARLRSQFGAEPPEQTADEG